MNATLATPPQTPAAPTPAPSPAFVQLLWPSGDDEAQAMARRGILVCQTGQPIAHQVVPADPNSTPAGVPLDALRLGRSVAWDPARSVYVARQDGLARLKGNLLQVEDALEFIEDLDPTHGPVRFQGDILLQRNVLDLVELHGARDITIQGCLEAANVTAGRNLTIHRGICGKEKGRVHAAGSLSARFLTNAHVVAGADVAIENVSDNSSILCGGELRADQGTLLSGHAIAGVAIHCHTAGSQAGSRAILELGIAPEKYAQIKRLSNEAQLCRARAGEIRNLIQPLMARLKSLTPAQKEKATELLYNADEMEAKAADLARTLDSLEQPLAQAARGAIHIASIVYAGVLIRFPGVQAPVMTFLRGPLTITLASQGGRQVVVCTDDYRGTKTCLSTVDQSAPVPNA